MCCSDKEIHLQSVELHYQHECEVLHIEPDS